MGRSYYILLPFMVWGCACSFQMKIPCRFCNMTTDDTCPEQNTELKCFENLKDGELREGDIYNLKMLSIGESFSSFSSGRSSYIKKWTNRMVPYQILGFSKSEEYKVHKLIDTFMKIVPCIKFCDKTKEKACKESKDFVNIIKNQGCYSQLGKQGGSQDLSLGCTYNKSGTVYHELMHALGFMHEHNRFDRDKNIEVRWDHIKNGRNNVDFQKRKEGEPGDYDFGSIMHYSLYAFSIDGKKTLMPKSGANLSKIDVMNIGQRDHLTNEDIRKIRIKYECDIASCKSPYPQELPNGHTSSNSERYPVRFKIEYECNEGYILFGASIRECQYDGTWSGEQPYCFEKKEVLEACTFDEDIYDEDDKYCKWENINDKWKQTPFPTPTDGSGPDYDKTEKGTRLGQYLFLESSSPAKKGDTAKLKYDLNEYCNGRCNTKICISLWYNMYGDDGMGTLIIKTGTHIIWKQTGNQGRSWKNVLECFDGGNVKELTIEAIRGETYRSDIAIDEVVIANREVMRQYCNIIMEKESEMDCNNLRFP